MHYNLTVMNAPNDDLLLAQQWFARLQTQQTVTAPAETPLPGRWINAIAQLVSLALHGGYLIQVVVPDDETLPELSNALDLDLRPLCLILPEAEFATRIALRATLTLLKSRLARHAETSLVWDQQHQQINRLSGLWADTLTWGKQESSTAPWPAEIAHLFPALLLPASHMCSLAGNSHLSAANGAATLRVLIAPERYASTWRDQLAETDGSVHILCLSAALRGAEHRQLIPADETTQQRLELDVLGREIAELTLELATAQGEIAQFTQRYYSVVGSLMVELDTINAKIALHLAQQQPQNIPLQAEAQTSQAQAERSQQEQQRFEEIPHRASEQTFAPSTDLRKLYRQIAQKIHPDRAASEGERAWRTQLMAEANRAYSQNDETALREVLSLWQEGQDNTAARTEAQGSSNTINTQNNHGLALQLSRMRQRLANIQGELDRLLGSKLYELFVATRLARRQGRDLLEEMASNLTLQLAAARQRLAALEADQLDAPPTSAV